MKTTLLTLLALLAVSSSAFANAPMYMPNTPFGPYYPQPAEDIRWLDAARVAERALIGRTIYFDLRDRDGFFFAVVTPEGLKKSSSASVEGTLVAVRDQGTMAFYYTLRLRNGDLVTVVTGGAKNYEQHQRLRWVK